MNWLNDNEFSARPLVVVEDHVYHISELLRTIQKDSADLLANLTIVCLDRSGPDTDQAILEWLDQYPMIQVAGRFADPHSVTPYSVRVLALNDRVFLDQNEYCKQIAALVRKRGLLLQDIELETLAFVPRDRWWETTMLASTVRGIVGDRPPHCAFISNKRGYEATFGAELLAAGHDPRDVLNKYELERLVVPFLQKHMRDQFPLVLRWQPSWLPEPTVVSTSVSREYQEQHEIESVLDVVLWPPKDQTCEIGGRSFAGKKSPIALAADGHELATWQDLIQARIENRPGVKVVDIGTRVAPVGALRAEVTNAAARHIHSLRKRLDNSQDIVTVQGHYRLGESLRVALAVEHQRSRGGN